LLDKRIHPGQLFGALHLDVALHGAE
jgi:hypothetical protein